MNLYRIMLVDDEEEVRKSMIKKVDWEQLGFQVVGDAENGQDALEKIEVLEPDVVMTDIRMPYMDGLTLIEKIKPKYPALKFLIFSGFDDFEYAQQAIKLHVAEYILKPVNVEELTEILMKVKANLDEEIEQKRNMSLLQERYKTNLPIIREMYLNDLIYNRINEEEIYDKLEEYEIDILDASQWAIAVILPEDQDMRGMELFPLEQELIPISIKGLVEDYTKGYFRHTVFSTSQGIAVILAIDEEKNCIILNDFWNGILKECKRILGISVTIGVGSICKSLSALEKGYTLAVDALGYRSIVEQNQVIYIEDVEPMQRGKLQLESKDESDLIAAIKFGSIEQIKEVAGRIAAPMEDAKVHKKQMEIYRLSVLHCLLSVIQQYDLDMRLVLGEEQDYLLGLNRLTHKEEFGNWILHCGTRMNQIMKQEREHTNRQVIEKAKAYIEQHYQDPELSVETICGQLHMSAAYFSTMFKKETGQAYIAYLTEVRLNKAVELLKETDDKTYIIAAKVGYQEQNYFSYVFKKHFGISPTKFRGMS